MTRTARYPGRSKGRGVSALSATMVMLLCLLFPGCFKLEVDNNIITECAEGEHDPRLHGYWQETIPTGKIFYFFDCRSGHYAIYQNEPDTRKCTALDKSLLWMTRGDTLTLVETTGYNDALVQEIRYSLSETIPQKVLVEDIEWITRIR